MDLYYRSVGRGANLLLNVGIEHIRKLLFGKNRNAREEWLVEWIYANRRRVVYD